MTFNNIPDPRNIELPKVKSLAQLKAEAKKDDPIVSKVESIEAIAAMMAENDRLAEEARMKDILMVQAMKDKQDRKAREERRQAAKQANTSKNNGWSFDRI